MNQTAAKTRTALLADAASLAAQRADLVTMSQTYIAGLMTSGNAALARPLIDAQAHAAAGLDDLERRLRNLARIIETAS